MIMETYLVLKEAVAAMKLGELEGFESLFFMTYEEAFDHAVFLTQEEDLAKLLLMETYQEMYLDIGRAPVTEEIPEWICFLMEDAAYRLYQVNPATVEKQENFALERLSREQAASILLETEEILGIGKEMKMNITSAERQEIDFFRKWRTILVLTLLAFVLAASLFGFLRIRAVLRDFESRENPFGQETIETSYHDSSKSTIT